MWKIKDRLILYFLLAYICNNLYKKPERLPTEWIAMVIFGDRPETAGNGQGELYILCFVFLKEEVLPA